jgi:hypothetical protein
MRSAYDDMGGITLNVVNIGAMLDFMATAVGRAEGGHSETAEALYGASMYVDTGVLELTLGRGGVTGRIGTGGIDVGGSLYDVAKRGLDYATMMAYAKGTDNQRAVMKNYIYGDFTQENTSARIASGVDILTITKDDGNGTPNGVTVRDKDDRSRRIIEIEDQGTINNTAVILGHESYRDGIKAVDNPLETQRAVKAHTEMADRMRSAGVDIDLSGLIGAELVLYDIARALNDMSLMNKYIDENYDSSEDFWKLTKDKNGIWGWEDDKKADFDISEALVDDGFKKQLSGLFGSTIFEALSKSNIQDGKAFGTISTGRMDSDIASHLGMLLNPSAFDFRLNLGGLIFSTNEQMKNDANQSLFIKETNEKIQYNEQHTTTIYNKSNRPITVWNIDVANDVISQLLKQNNPALTNIENMARYGCNFMVILGYTQMLTRSTLSPDEIANIWETAIAKKYMDNEGTVSAYGMIADLSLQKIGRNDIGLNFDTYWKTYNDGTLIGHRIQVPFQTDSHYLLGDKTTDPRPNWIYNPGTTYSTPHTNNYGVRIYAK